MVEICPLLYHPPGGDAGVCGWVQRVLIPTPHLDPLLIYKGKVGRKYIFYRGPGVCCMFLEIILESCPDPVPKPPKLALAPPLLLDHG